MAIHVCLDLSSMRTPPSISLMMIVWDSLNMLFNSAVQVNREPGLRDWRKGCFRAEAAKAYDTWLMRCAECRRGTCGMDGCWWA